MKKFAQRMIDDHSKALDELKGIAESKKITLPTTIDAEHKTLSDRLSKTSGAAFDRDYMQAMVDGQKKVAADFRKVLPRRRAGTLAPSSLASLKPMAIACLRLLTVRPEPLLSVPRLRRRIADFTRFDALLPSLTPPERRRLQVPCSDRRQCEHERRHQAVPRLR